jgi:hypothetical protein
MKYGAAYFVMSVNGSTTALILQKSADLLIWVISLGFANIHILFLTTLRSCCSQVLEHITESNSQWRNAKATGSHTARASGDNHDHCTH